MGSFTSRLWLLDAVLRSHGLGEIRVFQWRRTDEISDFELILG